MSLYALAGASERAAKIARENADHAAGIDAMRQNIAALEHQRDAFKDAAAFHKSRADDAEKQRDELMAAYEKTISENGHLADGDVCTLIDIKQSIASVKGQQ